MLEELAAFVAAAGLEPGSRLPAERELALRLKVGRSTIREALKRWQALGVVEMRKGSGTYLKAPLGDDAVHLSITVRLKQDSLLRALEVRRALEAEAAAIAARRATPDDLAHIRDCLERMEAVHLRYGEAPAEDWEFHLSIYRATGNPLFLQLVSALHDALFSFFTNPLNQPGFASRSFPLHRELFEAIAARDPETARAKALAILAITEEDLRAARHAP
ncbi:FadR/GntR family transcriptional regulator [Benzoatithermus flavus]|uniref:FadR/GntR family transcriptional regulator n=1 Tax=Benzoatithermus flavus TaxID=3108223 RepID=A0ABU8XYB0_9PROT